MPEDYPWRYQGPGSRERKWWNRLHFWLLGTWPDSVVAERLSNTQIVVDRITRVRRIERDYVDLNLLDDVKVIPDERKPTDG